MKEYKLITEEQFDEATENKFCNTNNLWKSLPSINLDGLKEILIRISDNYEIIDGCCQYCCNPEYFTDDDSEPISINHEVDCTVTEANQLLKQLEGAKHYERCNIVKKCEKRET